MGSDWLHTRKGRGETRCNFFSLGPRSLAFNESIALWVGWTEDTTLKKTWLPSGLFVLMVCSSCFHLDEKEATAFKGATGSHGP